MGPHMGEQQLTAEVVDRLAATPDPRLREVTQSLVRHLHAFVRDVRLTEPEWQAGIAFLTATGQLCDGQRQEFVLLSDTLGLSSLVDMVNHGSDDPAATEPTILGPFYVPGSPWRALGESMVEWDDGGEPALLTGRVVSAVDGAPVADAVLDVWQAATNGFYAVQQADVQPSTNLRGRYRTGADGRFAIRTVRPVPYPVPDDGPVGRLLASTGRHPWRAAHIHVRVEAPGFAQLTTHVFDGASDYLDTDTVFGVKDSLVRGFTPGPDGVLVCDCDMVVRPV
jgi:protocatechuate 3,4-dioxygenase beta subunit